ncbi:MAG: hypothetical protein PHP02_06055 [Eubacteriales bacterium]|nr:hypothetical protein [Eubacteriales bacterium]
MLLFNGNQAADPQELALTCLPREGGGIIREVEAAWADLTLAQAAGILGACCAPVNLTFTDPVTGTRQTRAMALVSSLSQWAREGAGGAVFRLVRLTLREA